MNSDVLIVGGGMVGACAALTLAQQGLSVTLVDRFEPKAVGSDDVMELRVSALNLFSEHLLKSVGAWEGIESARSCLYRRLAVWEDDIEPVTFSAVEIESSHLGHIVENSVVQFALWQQCQQHDKITCLISDAIEHLVQTPESVGLEMGGEFHQARLLLACDGGQSKIRQMAGIGTEGWQYSQHALVVGVDTELPSQDMTWQQMSPTGPKAFLPLANGKGSLVWYHNADEVKRLKSLPESQLKILIQQAFPAQLGSFEIEQVASFPLVRQHAQNYLKGRIVLLGDSAHLINPLAGQGVNLGFKDVATLQSVIANAIQEGREWSCADVLCRYEKQRKLGNLAMMSAMDAIYATFSNSNPALKLLRQTGLKVVGQLPIARKLAAKYACGV